MASFEEIERKRESNIRKALTGALFVAPYSVTDEITDVLGPDGQLKALPAAYTDIGLITKEQGVTFVRETEVEKVMSMGRGDATRYDATEDVTSLQVTGQETKMQTLELYEGVSLADVAAKAAGTHVNISYDKPDKPVLIYYRAFALFKDGEGADAYYIAKWLPKVVVTDRGDQEYNDKKEIQYPLTMTALYDAKFGTAMRSMLGVPKGAVEDMGFTPPGP